MSHTDKNFKDFETELKKGYEEMSEINLEEANLSVAADNEALAVCEVKLTECE